MTTQNESGRVPAKNAARKTTERNHSGNSVDAQRARLLAALHERPMTTLEIRRELDILGPAPRVLELRRQGRNITTVRVDRPTDGGRLHRVAMYVFVPAERDLFSEPADLTAH